MCGQRRTTRINIDSKAKIYQTGTGHHKHRQNVEKAAQRGVHRDGKHAICCSAIPRVLNATTTQDTGNKVARKATLVGTQNIMLGGKTVIQQEVMIRGDLIRSLQTSSSSSGSTPASNTAVAIGRYCFLSRGCCLRPPGRLYKG